MVVYGTGKAGEGTGGYRTAPKGSWPLAVYTALYLIFVSKPFRDAFKGTAYSPENLSYEKLKALFWRAAKAENGFLAVIEGSILVGFFHEHPYLKGKDASVLLWFSLKPLAGKKTLKAFEEAAEGYGVSRIRLGVSTGKALKAYMAREGYAYIGDNFEKRV